MPANADFAFDILVGGIRVPEYDKDGACYVESNLYTPVSYEQKQSEVINGETEAQYWPVTPYKIRVRCFTADRSYLRVFVDGVKVKGLGMQIGEQKDIKGFRDNKVLREFLFSMPRFAKNETDRLLTNRAPSVGKVEIECWNAELRSTNWELRRKDLDFDQANKKDCYKVTGGAYTMATSRAGRVVTQRAQYRNVDRWRRVSLRSSLSVTYHMGHTLRDMGFTLLPFPGDFPAGAASHPAGIKAEKPDKAAASAKSTSLVAGTCGSSTAGKPVKVKPDPEVLTLAPNLALGAGTNQNPITPNLALGAGTNQKPITPNLALGGGTNQNPITLDLSSEDES